MCRVATACRVGIAWLSAIIADATMARCFAASCVSSRP